MKRTYRYTLPLIVFGMLQSAQASNTDASVRSWAESTQSTATNSFKSGDATTVPNYKADHGVDGSYASDTVGMKNAATSETVSDEGAILIYARGRTTLDKDEKWYQDANGITNDPSTVIDTSNGEYSDCETITQPGDTTIKQTSCTDTVLPATRACSIGREIEVDAHHLYECTVTQGSATASCNTERVIDVDADYKYQCSSGEESYEKDCSDELQVTVTLLSHAIAPVDGQCPPNFNLYPSDGLCYPPEELNQESPYTVCNQGSLIEGSCITEPMWVEQFVNAGYYQTLVTEWLDGSCTYSLHALDPNNPWVVIRAYSLGAVTHASCDGVQKLPRTTGTTGPAQIYAKKGEFRNINHALGGVKQYTIITSETEPVVTTPIYKCPESTYSPSGSDTVLVGELCYGLSKTYEITDNWVNSCN